MPLLRARMQERASMVDWQLARRGINDERVLRAMLEVPREAFVPAHLVEFAYEDSALPIAEGQTISQPYVVALMLEALNLQPSDRVLDVGTGSGYAAAVASRIAAEVYTIERIRSLAELAEKAFRQLGYHNIHVRVGDGSLGWPEAAPYDAIMVAAAGPAVPPRLLDQLAEGGRLVIPTGSEYAQRLIRVTRTSDGLVEDDLGDVRFVPLIGEAAWPDQEPAEETRRSRWGRQRPRPRTAFPTPRTTPTAPTVGAPTGVQGRASLPTTEPGLAERVASSAEAFSSIDEVDLQGLLARAGDAPLVLLGEATHGTSEFYRMRARVTKELVEQRGFRVVAIEADWPDAARVDAWVRGYPPTQPDMQPFARFPTWMWRNEEFGALVSWMRDFNEGRPEEDRVGLFGLDLYSLYASIEAVLRYLDDVDPEAAGAARERYGCLSAVAGYPAT